VANLLSGPSGPELLLALAYRASTELESVNKTARTLIPLGHGMEYNGKEGAEEHPVPAEERSGRVDYFK